MSFLFDRKTAVSQCPLGYKTEFLQHLVQNIVLVNTCAFLCTPLHKQLQRAILVLWILVFQRTQLCEC